MKKNVPQSCSSNQKERLLENKLIEKKLEIIQLLYSPTCQTKICGQTVRSDLSVGFTKAATIKRGLLTVIIPLFSTLSVHVTGGMFFVFLFPSPG